MKEGRKEGKKERRNVAEVGAFTVYQNGGVGIAD